MSFISFLAADRIALGFDAINSETRTGRWAGAVPPI
jgi:hypothetical protein